MGRVAELVVKTLLLGIGKTSHREPFYKLVGKVFLDGEYFSMYSKHLPYIQDLLVCIIRET